MTAGVAVLAFSLAWNVALLLAGRTLYAERADLTRAFVDARDDRSAAARRRPEPEPRPRAVAGQLRGSSRRYGSPMADSLAPGVDPAGIGRRS